MTSACLYSSHFNTRTFVKSQLIKLLDSKKMKWFSVLIDQQISTAVVAYVEGMEEAHWLRNSPQIQAIVEALCDYLGMCDEEHPYISPYTEALVIALMYWRTKHGMTDMVVTGHNAQDTWVDYVDELALKLKPDILIERKAYCSRGKHADKVDALASQRMASFKTWEIYCKNDKV